MKQLLVSASLIVASSGVAHAKTDALAPVATVDTPRAQTTYLTTQVAGGRVTGSARDSAGGSGVSGVNISGTARFYDGRSFGLSSGKSLPTALSSSSDIKTWNFRLPGTVAGIMPGVHRSGNSGSSSLASFSVRDAAQPMQSGDVTPPTVSVLTPSDGGTYSATNTRFGAIGGVADNTGGLGIATVHVIAYRYADANGPAGYFNGQTFSSATPLEVATRVPKTTGDKQTQWLFDPNPFVFTAGTILVTAVARDKAGNTSYASITFTRA